MNKLSYRDRELVALGAAIAANCVPCVKHHVPKGRKAGLSNAELTEVFELADRVRQVPARLVLESANQVLAGKVESPENTGEVDCHQMMGELLNRDSCC